MANQVEILKVVVASPGDVAAERDTVSRVIEYINSSICDDRGLRLETIRWETASHPGFHRDGPQGLIDSRLGIDKCALVIGIFWKHFGTPTHDSDSGTQHEFRLAYQAWQKNQRPEIMMYFNQASYCPKSKEEVFQWGQVLEFRNEFPPEGFWWPYTGVSDFENLLRNNLTQFLRTNYPLSTRSKSESQGGSGAIREERRKREELSIERIRGAMLQLARLPGEENTIAVEEKPHGRLIVKHGDICEASEEIIVSSDDNEFTARGGVSKAILDKLGPDVETQLAHFREQNFKQGHIAVTTGGNWKKRAVIHAVLVGLNTNQWPTLECIRSVTQKALQCAAALGAKSIAFPVLGGGYATTGYTPADSVNAIVLEILSFLNDPNVRQDDLTQVGLYIFRREDAGGLPRELLEMDGDAP